MGCLFYRSLLYFLSVLVMDLEVSQTSWASEVPSLLSDDLLNAAMPALEPSTPVPPQGVTDFTLASATPSSAGAISDPSARFAETRHPSTSGVPRFGSFAAAVLGSRPNIPFFPLKVDRSNTIVVRVPSGFYARASYTREKFMSVLFKLVRPESVCSVQLCPGCNFRVTFKPAFQAEKTKLLLRGLSSEGVFFPRF